MTDGAGILAASAGPATARPGPDGGHPQQTDRSDPRAGERECHLQKQSGGDHAQKQGRPHQPQNGHVKTEGGA